MESVEANLAEICAIKAKFHYAIVLANQLASWFANCSATCYSELVADLVSDLSQTGSSYLDMSI